MNAILTKLLKDNLGKDLPAYGEKIIADLIPAMTQSLGLVNQAPGEMGEFDDATRAVISKALGGEASYDVTDKTMTKRFQDSVVAPLMRTFDTEIKPQIAQQFSALGGTFSSRRGQAVGSALEGLQGQMGSELANMLYRNEELKAQLAESAANRQLGAVGLGEAFGQRSISRANALTQAASPFQAYEQSKNTAGYNDWLRTRAENSPYLSAALNYMGQSQTASYLQTSQNPGIDWGSLGQAAGMAGGIIGGALTPGVNPLTEGLMWSLLGKSAGTGLNALG